MILTKAGCLVIILVVCCLQRGSATAGHARSLKEISAQVNADLAVMNLTAFTLSNQAEGSQCIIQGYPGSRADSVVAGPLVLYAAQSINRVRVLFPASSSGSAVVLYNHSRSVVYNNDTEGRLAEADYYKSSSIGSTGAFLAGLILDYNPADPLHNAYSQPACYVNVTFVTTNQGPSVAPTSALIG